MPPPPDESTLSSIGSTTGSHSEAPAGSPDDQFAGFLPNKEESTQQADATARVIEEKAGGAGAGEAGGQPTKTEAGGGTPPPTRTTTTEFDPSKLSGQKRRWWDEEIKPHYETVSQKAARVAELEQQIAEREAKLKELEPFKSRVAELEPLTTELDGLKKKLGTYDETLIQGFTPPYNPASDPEIAELERNYAETRQRKVAGLIKSELIDPDDENSAQLAAADARKLNAEHNQILNWAASQKTDLNSILEAQKFLKKSGFHDPAGVWNAAQELLRERIAIGKKIQERQAGHVETSAKGWEGRRSEITKLIETRFSTPIPTLEKKIADGVELTDDEVWTAAARLLPEDERVALMREAITQAQEIYAGAKPVSREELKKNPQLLQELMVRERDVRGKIAPTLLQGATSKLQTKVIRTLMEENKKLKARAEAKVAATGVPRDAGGATQEGTITSGKDQSASREELERKKEDAFAGI